MKEEIIVTISENCMENFVDSSPLSSSDSPPPAKKLKGLATILMQIERQTGSDTDTTSILSVSEKLNLEISSYLL